MERLARSQEVLHAGDVDGEEEDLLQRTSGPAAPRPHQPEQPGQAVQAEEHGERAQAEESHRGHAVDGGALRPEGD